MTIAPVLRLVRTTARDGVELDGAMWTPAGGRARSGIALASGTGNEFYTKWPAWLAEHLAAAGYLTLSLNRRDHGAHFGFHDLETSSLDHEYAIDMLIEAGAERVVLGGHSYGTVTVPFYVAATDDSRVAACLLYAPLGDMRPASVTIVGGQERYDYIVETARAMVAEGRGHEAFVIPPMIPGGMPMTHTYRSFLNKRGPQSRGVPTDLLQRVGDRPIFGIRDPADPFPATLPPAQEKLEAANPRLDYVLLSDTHNGLMDPAAHYFEHREEEVLSITLDWLARHGLTP